MMARSPVHSDMQSENDTAKSAETCVRPKWATYVHEIVHRNRFMHD
ncbi:hypothetical protein BN2476_630022 [Paraburkholderia piptadeniae]|uniref:Uncharacterized protein n=2 Tax=Paraburkholderia piptadeniae TaxID=1701573 RepID=A0A1N7SL76_9BURK|nr:hypothetical protein BN2476_630022 [Paraburkholderia piptadeniae]